MKSVCSARDSGQGNLVDWVLGSMKESSTKDSECSYNQYINKFSEAGFLMCYFWNNFPSSILDLVPYRVGNTIIDGFGSIQ